MGRITTTFEAALGDGTGFLGQFKGDKMRKEKPDGWVIWSEAGGLWARLDPEGREQLCIYPSDVYDLGDLTGRHGVELIKGQRLRPVKIVFLDE